MATLAEALREAPLDETTVSGSVFFTVVDAKPETAKFLRVLHMVSSRTLMKVVVLPAEASGGERVRMALGGEARSIDLSGWLVGGVFIELLRSLRVWQCSPGQISVEVLPVVLDQPQLGSLPLRPPGCLARDGEEAVVGEAIVPFEEADTEGGLLATAQPSSFTARCRPIVEHLLQAKCFAENGEFCDAWSFTNFDRGAAEHLAKCDILVASVNEFLEPTFALKLARISINGSMICQKARLVVSAPLRNAPLAAWGKLELVQHLLRSGWTPIGAADPCPEFHHEGGAKRFLAQCIFQSRFYLHCLSMATFIFQKPGGLRGILHRGVESYFKALLQLRDLSVVERLGEAGQRALRDREAKALASAETALADDIDDEPMPDLEAQLAALLDVDAGQPCPSAMPIVPVEMSIRSRVPGTTATTVYFDRFTHSSGNQRAFVHCNAHRKCRLYIFVRGQPSKEHCAAYLMAWAWAGSRWADVAQGAEHIAHKPSPEEVALVFMEQFG